MTYFIADIGANHDGELERARELIKLAKEAGADCAKFQHFKAESIVSRQGFESIGKSAHQAAWEKPVYEVYQQYSINRDWNSILAETAKSVGIHFMTTPYDFEAVDQVFDLVSGYKIGSGDITYLPLIKHIACQWKPVYLATGASTMEEVEIAVKTVLRHNHQLTLLQCNTNYTGSLENFKHVNINVLRSYAIHWPHLTLGLSDHTPGHSSVLGAVALGASVVEKHFTDDNTRSGPDHAFALTHRSWKEMVKATWELEMAMGDGVKRVENNEDESVIVQRRALRLKSDCERGHLLSPDDFEMLRPCPEGAYTPAQVNEVIGGALVQSLPAGRELYPENLA